MVREVVSELNESNLSDVNNFIDELGNEGGCVEEMNKISKEESSG